MATILDSFMARRAIQIDDEGGNFSVLSIVLKCGTCNTRAVWSPKMNYSTCSCGNILIRDGHITFGGENHGG